jgi:hypothetical protein
MLRRRDLHSYDFHPAPDRKDCGAIPARRRYPERPERGVLCYRLRSICTWKDGPGQLDAQPGPTTAVGNAHTSEEVSPLSWIATERNPVRLPKILSKKFRPRVYSRTGVSLFRSRSSDR